MGVNGARVFEAPVSASIHQKSNLIETSGIRNCFRRDWLFLRKISILKSTSCKGYHASINFGTNRYRNFKNLNFPLTFLNTADWSLCYHAQQIRI